MSPDFLHEQFERISDAPGAVTRLRGFVLGLAVRGKLIPQSTDDESAHELLARIRAVNVHPTRRPKSDTSLHAEGPFELPESWQWVPLGERLEMVNGRAFKPTDWLPKGLPIVRIQNLNNVAAPFNHCDESTVKERHITTSDSFLISWSGTPGTSFGAFIWQRGKAALNQHILSCFQRGEV